MADTLGPWTFPTLHCRLRSSRAVVCEEKVTLQFQFSFPARNVSRACNALILERNSAR